MWIGNEATEMRDIHYSAGLLPGRALVTIEGPDASHFLHFIRPIRLIRGSFTSSDFPGLVIASRGALL